MRAVVLLLLLASTAHAGLEWRERSCELWAVPGDTNVVARYAFTNGSDRPVTLTALTPSCGCTVASTAKKKYLPGEKGEVAVVFTVGDRRGRQDKTILVSTDDAPKPVTLDLHVTIAELFKIKPSALEWKRGEARTPKVLMLELAENQPIHVRDVKSSLPGLTPKLETQVEGQSYVVIVTPKDTATVTNGWLKIQTDFPAENPRALRVPVRITPSRSE